MKTATLTKPLAHNKSKAVYYLTDIIRFLGLAFHPDNPASEYTEQSGKQTFTPEECKVIDKNLNTVHEQLGERVYTISMYIWYKEGFWSYKDYVNYTGLGESEPVISITEIINKIAEHEGISKRCLMQLLGFHPTLLANLAKIESASVKLFDGICILYGHLDCVQQFKEQVIHPASPVK
jgi:hypothetical protein